MRNRSCFRAISAISSSMSRGYTAPVGLSGESSKMPAIESLYLTLLRISSMSGNQPLCGSSSYVTCPYPECAASADECVLYAGDGPNTRASRRRNPYTLATASPSPLKNMMSSAVIRTPPARSLTVAARNSRVSGTPCVSQYPQDRG